MIRFIDRLALVSALGLTLAVSTARADDQPPPIPLTIKDHKFSPAEIHLPAGKAAFLEITNADSEPEEFEMRQLAIEKVIPAGGTGRVRLRPLGPGRYAFIGEFHEATAQGTVVAE